VKEEEVICSRTVKGWTTWETGKRNGRSKGVGGRLLSVECMGSGKKMKEWPRVRSSHKKLIAVLSYIYTGSGKMVDKSSNFAHTKSLFAG
jgi:hypothetical protein